MLAVSADQPPENGFFKQEPPSSEQFSFSSLRAKSRTLLSYANANGLQRPLDALADNLRIFGSKTDGHGALTAPQLEWFRNKLSSVAGSGTDCDRQNEQHETNGEQDVPAVFILQIHSSLVSTL